MSLAGLSRRKIPLVAAILGVLPALAVFGGWALSTEVPFARFARPWLTLPAAAIVVWIAFRLLRLSPRTPRLRRALIELWSVSAALAAALAVCGLEAGLPLDRLTVVVAIDRSRSIDLVPGAAARIASELRVAELGMREEDRIAVVAFGATAAVEDPARPKTRLPSPQKADVARDGTDLGLGIRQALAEVPPDSAARVVVVSDGVATRGDAARAALAATALGVPVDVVALDQGEVPSVRVDALRIAPRAAEGEALDLKIVTRASAETEVEVRVYRDGELVRKGLTRVAADEDVIALRELAPGPGLHRYDVEISAVDAARDRSPADNAGAAFVRVRGASTALVIESEPALGRPMADALRSAAFQVDVVGRSATPADVAALARYDLVVLGDVSASDFSASQLDALKSYVRDLGGGLLLLGGDHAMGPGGYGRTPVEDVSPVSFDLKQERRRASLAEVIAVDYSGSMAMSAGDKTKLELANEAAARSAELLGAGDRLGVMHVDTAVSWTVPLGPVSDKADIAARIRKVAPGGGGIYVDLALSAGYAALAREQVQLKHLLLFSDGSDAEERTRAFSIVGGAAKSGVTTSVVALGNGPDVPALARMAEIGGGRFYLIEDATRLPAVFAQETVLASRSALNEVDFVPRAVGRGPSLRGVDFGAAPVLHGYVVTLPKARAELELVGPEGDPLLATWAAGVGRAAAFTSDYKDRWGANWTSWSGAARLFAQLGRDLARRGDDPRVRLEADASGGELHARATVVDDRGRSESFRRLRVKIGGPDGFSRELTLEATGAGSYEARLPLARPGAYLATLVDDADGAALATTGAVLSAGEELRPTGTDRAGLRRVAELTSGKVRDTLAGVFHDRDAERFAYAPLGAFLSAFAAVALLFAVASRRWSLPEWTRKPKPESAVPAGPVGAARGGAHSATLAALQKRKERREPDFARPAARAEPEPPPRAETPAAEAQSAETPAHGPRRGVARPPSSPPGAPPAKSAAQLLLEKRRLRPRK